MIDLTTASVVFCLGVGVLFLALWIYYDRRDHAEFEAERRKMIFHCIRCDHVYAAQGKRAESQCPECGQKNGRLRF